MMAGDPVLKTLCHLQDKIKNPWPGIQGSCFCLSQLLTDAYFGHCLCPHLLSCLFNLSHLQNSLAPIQVWVRE